MYESDYDESDSYDEQIAQLEAGILHLNALKMAQEDGSNAAWNYQQDINALTRRAMALRVARGELESYDQRIRQAKRAALRAFDRATHAMDMAWGTVKWCGGVGLFLLLICMTGWVSGLLLPVITGLFLLVAVGAGVLAVRSRPALYEEADSASAAQTRLENERQALLAQAEAGNYPPPPAPVLAERVPEPRPPGLSLVQPRDDDSVDNADVIEIDPGDDVED